MNKKRRILLAGLMIVAVTGASTFAYFTSSNPITANTGSPLKLDITNGTVNVTGEIGDGGSTPNWTYDIVSGAADKDRSPDIDLNGTDAGKGWVGDDAANPKVNGLYRSPIGTPVTGAISYARPGDAFIFGGAGSTDKKGLVVTNKSNLTVKVNVALNESTQMIGTGDSAEVEIIKNLQNAGWKLYINGVEISSATKSAVNTALGASDFILNPAGSASDVTKTISIKIEFPLDNGDTYQGSTANGSVSNFDIKDLFIIKATQENK